jgi:hypothetical protein
MYIHARVTGTVQVSVCDICRPFESIGSQVRPWTTTDRPTNPGLLWDPNIQRRLSSSSTTLNITNTNTITLSLSSRHWGHCEQEEHTHDDRYESDDYDLVRHETTAHKPFHCTTRYTSPNPDHLILCIQQETKETICTQREREGQ